MSITFNDNILVSSGKAVDAKYMNGNLPYVDEAEVLSKIPLQQRHIGLTVNIDNAEWWFKDNTTTLVLKGSSADTTTVVLKNPITLVGTNYGMYEDGDTILSGTTVQTIFENMMTKVIHPTYTVPTINLTPNNYNIEIGTPINIALSTTFVQNDAGTVTNYTLVRNYNSANTTLVNSGTVSSYTDNSASPILSSNLIYTATVAYANGAIKNNNLGVADPTGRILAGSIVDTATIVGKRSYFKGATTDTTAPTTSANIRALINTIDPNNGTTFTINITAGSRRVCFAYPATLQNVTNVKYVESGNAEVKDTFTLTNVNVEGANAYTAISYKVYTFISTVAFGDTATYIVTI
jgi:hypothetical protein